MNVVKKNIYYMYYCIYCYLKETVNFAILCKPQKSSTSWVSITFPQITQKLLTIYTLQWLELITVILTFLYIYSVWGKQPLSSLDISENLQENQWKKNICLIYISRALKVIYRKSTQLIILYCLILTLITVCYMFRIKFPYLSLHIFSPSFSYFSHHEIFLKLAFNLITVFHTESFHYNLFKITCF